MQVTLWSSTSVWISSDLFAMPYDVCTGSALCTSTRVRTCRNMLLRTYTRLCASTMPSTMPTASRFDLLCASPSMLCSNACLPANTVLPTSTGLRASMRSGSKLLSGSASGLWLQVPTRSSMWITLRLLEQHSRH